MSTGGRRLVIGMLNTAGQGTEWAHALERSTIVAAESWGITRPKEQIITFKADRIYPLISGVGRHCDRQDWLRRDWCDGR